MNLLYCHDNFYTSDPEGAVYSPGQFPYEYWAPFRDSFDRITVVGRVKKLDNTIDFSCMNKSSGDGMRFELLPNISSPVQFFKNIRYVRACLTDLIAKADAVVVRSSGDLAFQAFLIARRMGKPVAVEMVSCPWDSTVNHGSWYSYPYAPVRFIQGRVMAASADFVLYVTGRFLQRRYPATGKTCVASNVRLPASIDNGVMHKRALRIERNMQQEGPRAIGLIGSLSNKLKGVEVALKALAAINEIYPGSFVFRHIGPGTPERVRHYIALARKYGIANSVHFDGMIPSGKPVTDWMDRIDIYLQPSFQEGLPRAVIEAMSRGCPVIASTAGGTPEILDPQWTHKPGRHEDLAALIGKMLFNFESQLENGVRNFEKSKEFSGERLIPVRTEFWREFSLLARAVEENIIDAQSRTPTPVTPVEV